MSKNLFKKLNEQIEINQIKESARVLKEDEIEKLEEEVVFKNRNNEILENLKITLE